MTFLATEDLLTDHVTPGGMRDMLTAIGLMEHAIPIDVFSVRHHDRERYIRGILHTAGYAVAERSGGRAQRTNAIARWAESAAAELEGLL